MDIPYLAGLVSSSVGRDNPIVTFGVSSRQKVWYDLSTLVKHPLWCLFSIGIFPKINSILVCYRLEPDCHRSSL
jgi:hypothetical protein